LFWRQNSIPNGSRPMARVTMRSAAMGLGMAAVVRMSAGAAAQAGRGAGGGGAGPGGGGALEARVRSIIERPEFSHSTWGVELYSLDSGRTVYSINGDKLFVPGSTTKLLTMGSALGLLGADYRFHTRVYRTGPVRSDGTLDGDLVLVASGDAKIG